MCAARGPIQIPFAERRIPISERLGAHKISSSTILAAVNGANYNITGQAKPERILGARVSLVLTEPGLVVVGSTTVPARVIAYFFACGTWTFPPLMVSGSNVRSVTSAPVGLVTFNPNRS